MGRQKNQGPISNLVVQQDSEIPERIIGIQSSDQNIQLYKVKYQDLPIIHSKWVQESEIDDFEKLFEDYYKTLMPQAEKNMHLEDKKQKVEPQIEMKKKDTPVTKDLQIQSIDSDDSSIIIQQNVVKQTLSKKLLKKLPTMKKGLEQLDNPAKRKWDQIDLTLLNDEPKPQDVTKNLLLNKKERIKANKQKFSQWSHLYEQNQKKQMIQSPKTNQNQQRIINQTNQLDDIVPQVDDNIFNSDLQLNLDQKDQSRQFIIINFISNNEIINEINVDIDAIKQQFIYDNNICNDLIQ